jgi:hypothetical protein
VCIQRRSRKCPFCRYIRECILLQGSYPVTRLGGEYLVSQAAQSYAELVPRTPVSRSTRQARQEGAKRPFRVVHFSQSRMENAKSGSGRLGTARPILPGASQGGELCAAAPVPLAGPLAKLSAVVYCGYPVATLEGYPVASLGVAPAVTLELPWGLPCTTG